MVGAIPTRLVRNVMKTITCATNLHEYHIFKLSCVIIKRLKNLISGLFGFHTTGHNIKSYQYFSVILLDCIALYINKQHTKFRKKIISRSKVITVRVTNGCKKSSFEKNGFEGLDLFYVL